MRFKSILVPTDFGESSGRATDLALALAQKFESKIVLVHGFEFPAFAYTGLGTASVDYLSPIEEAARERFSKTLVEVTARWPNTEGYFRKGSSWREILHAREAAGADLIVMGTHGRQGITHALLGSVAEKIVRLSPVPVLIARDAPQT